MDASFLTPLGAVVGLVAALPLAAFLLRERREGRVREALGLRPPRLARVPSVLALVAVALLALAAAQPAVHTTKTLRARTDAQLYFVFDISRSMSAAREPGSDTRFTRATDLGIRLRAALREVPAGVASLTDRALPHVMATSDRAAFEGVVRRALAVNRPPPMDATAARATDLEAIRYLATEGYFSPDSTRRLVIVLTDGESEDFSPANVGSVLQLYKVRPILVHVWDGDERVYGTDGRPERYRPDGRSAAALAALAREGGGQVYDEQDMDGIVAGARRFLGEGPEIVVGKERRTVRLAPDAILAAALTLAFLFAYVRVPRRAAHATATVADPRRAPPSGWAAPAWPRDGLLAARRSRTASSPHEEKGRLSAPRR